MTRLTAFEEPEPLRNGEFALGVPRCIVKVRSYPDFAEGVKLSPGRPISRILCAVRAPKCPYCRRPSILDVGLPAPPAAYPELRRSHARGRAAPGSSSLLELHHSCLALLLAGVTWPQPLLAAPVGSYPTFSPLPVLRLRRFVSVARSGS